MKMYFATFVALSLFALLFLGACQRQTAGSGAPLEVPKNFDWQGHRGCRGLLPENTIPAFLHALSFEAVTTLELDLAVSADGQLVVSHEPWFNADITTTPSGDSISKSQGENLLLYKMPLAEIQQYDVGKRGNPRFKEQEKMPASKPTLAQVVESVQLTYRNKTVRYNIEIKSDPDFDGKKSPAVADFVKLVLKEVKELGIAERSTIQSFDTRALEELHLQAPEQTVALLVENVLGLDANLAKLTFKPQIYSPYHLLVTQKMVKKCHSKGIKVIPWTVNDHDAMRSLIRKGVDGIITDYPNLIKTLR